MDDEIIFEIGKMNISQLEEYLHELRKELVRLDCIRPKNENSEQFELWADEHEELEDEIDDVTDRIDELAQK